MSAIEEYDRLSEIISTVENYLVSRDSLDESLISAVLICNENIAKLHSILNPENHTANASIVMRELICQANDPTKDMSEEDDDGGPISSLGVMWDDSISAIRTAVEGDLQYATTKLQDAKEQFDNTAVKENKVSFSVGLSSSAESPDLLARMSTAQDMLREHLKTDGTSTISVLKLLPLYESLLVKAFVFITSLGNTEREIIGTVQRNNISTADVAKIRDLEDDQAAAFVEVITDLLKNLHSIIRQFDQCTDKNDERNDYFVDCDDKRRANNPSDSDNCNNDSVDDTQFIANLNSCTQDIKQLKSPRRRLLEELGQIKSALLLSKANIKDKNAEETTVSVSKPDDLNINQNEKDLVKNVKIDSSSPAVVKDEGVSDHPLSVERLCSAVVTSNDNTESLMFDNCDKNENASLNTPLLLPVAELSAFSNGTVVAAAPQNKDEEDCSLSKKRHHGEGGGGGGEHSAEEKRANNTFDHDISVFSAMTKVAAASKEDDKKKEEKEQEEEEEEEDKNDDHHHHSNSPAFITSMDDSNDQLSPQIRDLVIDTAEREDKPSAAAAVYDAGGLLMHSDKKQEQELSSPVAVVYVDDDDDDMRWEGCGSIIHKVLMAFSTLHMKEAVLKLPLFTPKGHAIHISPVLEGKVLAEELLSIRNCWSSSSSSSSSSPALVGMSNDGQNKQQQENHEQEAAQIKLDNIQHTDDHDKDDDNIANGGAAAAAPGVTADGAPLRQARGKLSTGGTSGVGILLQEVVEDPTEKLLSPFDDEFALFCRECITRILPAGWQMKYDNDDLRERPYFVDTTSDPASGGVERRYRQHPARNRVRALAINRLKTLIMAQERSLLEGEAMSEASSPMLALISLSKYFLISGDVLHDSLESSVYKCNRAIHLLCAEIHGPKERKKLAHRIVYDLVTDSFSPNQSDPEPTGDNSDLTHFAVDSASSSAAAPMSLTLKRWHDSVAALRSITDDEVQETIYNLQREVDDFQRCFHDWYDRFCNEELSGLHKQLTSSVTETLSTVPAVSSKRPSKETTQEGAAAAGAGAAVTTVSSTAAAAAAAPQTSATSAYTQQRQREKEMLAKIRKSSSSSRDTAGSVAAAALYSYNTSTVQSVQSSHPPKINVNETNSFTSTANSSSIAASRSQTYKSPAELLAEKISSDLEQIIEYRGDSVFPDDMQEKLDDYQQVIGKLGKANRELLRLYQKNLEKLSSQFLPSLRKIEEEFSEKVNLSHSSAGNDLEKDQIIFVEKVAALFAEIESVLIQFSSDKSNASPFAVQFKAWNALTDSLRGPRHKLLDDLERLAKATEARLVAEEEARQQRERDLDDAKYVDDIEWEEYSAAESQLLMSLSPIYVKQAVREQQKKNISISALSDATKTTTAVAVAVAVHSSSAAIQTLSTSDEVNSTESIGPTDDTIISSVKNESGSGQNQEATCTQQLERVEHGLLKTAAEAAAIPSDGSWSEEWRKGKLFAVRLLGLAHCFESSPNSLAAVVPAGKGSDTAQETIQKKKSPTEFAADGIVSTLLSTQQKEDGTKNKKEGKKTEKNKRKLLKPPFDAELAFFCYEAITRLLPDGWVLKYGKKNSKSSHGSNSNSNSSNSHAVPYFYCASEGVVRWVHPVTKKLRNLIYQRWTVLLLAQDRDAAEKAAAAEEERKRREKDEFDKIRREMHIMSMSMQVQHAPVADELQRREQQQEQQQQQQQLEPKRAGKPPSPTSTTIKVPVPSDGPNTIIHSPSTTDAAESEYGGGSIAAGEDDPLEMMVSADEDDDVEGDLIMEAMSKKQFSVPVDKSFVDEMMANYSTNKQHSSSLLPNASSRGIVQRHRATVSASAASEAQSVSPNNNSNDEMRNRNNNNQSGESNDVGPVNAGVLARKVVTAGDASPSLQQQKQSSKVAAIKQQQQQQQNPSLRVRIKEELRAMQTRDEELRSPLHRNNLPSTSLKNINSPVAAVSSSSPAAATTTRPWHSLFVCSSMKEAKIVTAAIRKEVNEQLCGGGVRSKENPLVTPSNNIVMEDGMSIETFKIPCPTSSKRALAEAEGGAGDDEDVVVSYSSDADNNATYKLLQVRTRPAARSMWIVETTSPSVKAVVQKMPQLSQIVLLHQLQEGDIVEQKRSRAINNALKQVADLKSQNEQQQPPQQQHSDRRRANTGLGVGITVGGERVGGGRIIKRASPQGQLPRITTRRSGDGATVVGATTTGKGAAIDGSVRKKYIVPIIIDDTAPSSATKEKQSKKTLRRGEGGERGLLFARRISAVPAAVPAASAASTSSPPAEDDSHLRTRKGGTFDTKKTKVHKIAGGTGIVGGEDGKDLVRGDMSKNSQKDGPVENRSQTSTAGTATAAVVPTAQPAHRSGDRGSYLEDEDHAAIMADIHSLGLHDDDL